MLGESLKKAATSAAYNVNAESLRDLVEQIRAVSPELGARAEQELLREVRVAPTLVKYADPNPYEMETRRELRQAARELMESEPLAPSKAIVDLLDEEPLEVEIATTLLYEHCHHSLPPDSAGGAGFGRDGTGARSSISGCGIAASTMKCCAASAPGNSSASTS